MADCLVCTDNLTVEEILRLVAVCSEGSVAFRVKEVAFADACVDCQQYNTAEDLLRKSLWCDDDGNYYIQIVV